MKSFLLTYCLMASLAIADQLTIKSEPLKATTSLDATFIPTEATVIQIEPKQWKTFKIKTVVDHGTLVTKGDPLIIFDDKDYKRDLAEAIESAKERKIKLQKAERELTDLTVTTPHLLEGLKLAHNRAKEELDDFTKGGRALSEGDARERLEASKRTLSYYEEELNQLLKMYEEDGNTEETEEIILKRQRAAVKSAKFSLKKAEKSSKWTLEKIIPRKGIDLKRTYDEALLAFETGKLNLPRALEEKTLAVAKARRDNTEADKNLAELKEDARFFTLTAPTDGLVYYGEIDDQSWSIGDSAKFLFENGAAPAKKILLSLIPTDSALILTGSVNQSERLQIPTEAQGSANVEGLENSAYPITLTTIAAVPNGAGKYDLSMSVELPEDSPIVTGMKAKVEIVTYKNDNAISVPKTAITTKDGISTVKLKMADGADEIREVKLGRSVADHIEIIEGLEIDQVILVPDSAKP